MAKTRKANTKVDTTDLQLPKAVLKLPHIYRGSYRKSSHKYDDNCLADSGPAHPDRIAAGASMLIVSRSEEWRDKQDSPLLCIHVKDGSSIGAQSVYPVKLIAIVAALQLAANVQTPTTEEIVTDSMGNCQIANRRKQQPQLTNNYIALISPLQHLTDYKGKIRWTPAHPEKRNSMSANWTREDCLNHVADKVAT